MNKMLSRSTMVAAVMAVAGGTALAEGPVLHPNASSYHTQSASAATGRSGNAKLAVRALLNQSGSTDVDVTTGVLDSTAVAPGNISKLQVKAYNGLGDVQWAKNYTGLTSGGTLHYSYDDLHRGQPIQSQANIRSIDGKRTDVITVTGNVKLRPDLAVRKLDAPSRATLGTLVNIAATVAEVNGDVGANGNCVLRVDGAEVDRAPGIWVDGGSTVSCAFTHKFDTTGTKVLEVAITDVVPGDYDLSNNAASATIEIVSASAPFYYWANAGNYRWDYSGRNDGWYRHDDGTYASASDWNSTYASHGWHEYAYLGGWSPVRLTFPLAQVNLAGVADGATVHSTSFQNLSPDWTWSWGDGSEEGVWRFDPASYTYFYLYSWSWSNYAGTSTGYQRYAGEVTYFSAGYSHYWYRYDGGSYEGYYTWNYDYNYGYGTGWPMNATYDFNFDVTDANGVVLQATPHVDLQPFNYDYDQGYTCWDYAWSWGAEHHCGEWHSHYSGYQGWTYGQTGN